MAYEFFPDANSELQRDWQALFTKIFWVALVVFVLVEGIIVYAIVRFRRRKGGPSEGPHVHGNTRMEIAWTIAPTLVMAWLLVVSLEQMQKTDTDPPIADIEVQVVARQFAFDFYYPGSTTPSVNLLRVEEDQVVGLHVTAVDVIHAINIPELGVMIDAVPGRMNYFWFRADEPGEFTLQCREFCGVGHGQMRFGASIVVFPAGTQDRPYGPNETTTPAPTNTTAPTGTNATQPNATTPPGEVRDVRLTEFAIEPVDLTLDPGSTISFNVKNDGAQPHNLYIGKFVDGATNNGAEWLTQDILGGGSEVLTVELPAEPGAWEWWCNVAGHRSLGMTGTLSTGGTLGEGPKPLLPGFELPMVIVAALGVALLAARRRK